jgi:hypothetical protein
MHLIFGKPVAFLAFDKYIDLKKDHELINYLILRVAKRLHDPYYERMHFALLELPYFPQIKQHLGF